MQQPKNWIETTSYLILFSNPRQRVLLVCFLYLLFFVFLSCSSKQKNTKRKNTLGYVLQVLKKTCVKRKIDGQCNNKFVTRNMTRAFREPRAIARARAHTHLKHLWRAKHRTPSYWFFFLINTFRITILQHIRGQQINFYSHSPTYFFFQTAEYYVLINIALCTSWKPRVCPEMTEQHVINRKSLPSLSLTNGLSHGTGWWAISYKRTSEISYFTWTSEKTWRKWEASL